MRVQNTRAEDSSISSYEALERGPAPTFRTSSSVYSNKKWRSFSVDAKRATMTAPEMMFVLSQTR